MAVAAQLVYRALDANGDPVSGAKLYFFDAGTSTERDVFTSSALSTTITQPVVSDANGWFQAIYIDGTAGNYKDRLHDASDVALRDDLDNISPAVQGTVPVSQGGTGATTASAARTALSVPSQAVHDALDTRVTTAETTISNNIDTTVETLTWGASVEIDHASQSTFYLQVQGTTSITITNMRTAGEFHLFLAQDATGGRAVTFSSDFDFGSDYPDLPTAANGIVHIVGKVYDSKVRCRVEWGSVPSNHAWDFLFEEQQSAGVDGTNSLATTETIRVINTEVYDYSGGASVSSNQITLDSSIFKRVALKIRAQTWNLQSWQLRLYDVTGGGSTRIAESPPVKRSNTSTMHWLELETEVDLSANVDLEVRVYSSNAVTAGHGTAGNIGSETEVYLQVFGKGLA